MMFIDVDGTLHGRQGVHPEIWAAVEQAREAGLPLSLCTGRPGSGVARRYAARLAPNGPHIFEAGACVTTAEGEVVHAEPLGPLASTECARAFDPSCHLGVAANGPWPR